jgi:DNA-directed RNA polymerase subunit H
LSSKKTFNVLDHVLVPKHERIPAEEVPKVLRELGLDPAQLPLIRASDPAARAVGARPGDLVKITRESETAGKIVVYRLVVVG